VAIIIKQLSFWLFHVLAFILFYNSLQTGAMLIINYEPNRTDKFPLREIIVNKKLDEFNSFMCDKMKTKFSVKKGKYLQPANTIFYRH
jgi:hypothetical protein